MKLENGILSVTKDELIMIIKSKPDNDNPESKQMNEKVIKMIEKHWGMFTPKQGNWILKKVRFIFRSSKKGTVKDLVFVDEKIPSLFVRKEDES